MQSLIGENGDSLKRQTHTALRELVTSSLRTLGLGVSGILLGYLAGSSQLENPNISKILGVLTLGSLGLAAVSSVDWEHDLEIYQTLSSRETRSLVIQNSLAEQLSRAIAETRHQKVPSQASRAETITQTLPEAPRSPLIDLPGSLAHNPSSTLIVGASRAGKGVTVAAALRKLDPKFSIWVVDPKADPVERNYWNPAHQVLSHKLNLWESQSQQGFEDSLRGFLQDFQKHPSPKILVIDELLALKESYPKFYREFLIPGLNTIASMGASRQTFVWGISQSPVAADFGTSAGARSAYRRVLLSRPNNRGLVASASSFCDTPLPPELRASQGVLAYDSFANHWAESLVASPPTEPAVLSNTWVGTSLETPTLTGLQERAVQYLRKNGATERPKLLANTKLPVSDLRILLELGLVKESEGMIWAP